LADANFPAAFASKWEAILVPGFLAPDRVFCYRGNVAGKAGTAEAAMTPAPAIVAIAHHYPEQVLANAELAQRFGKSEQWILERSGIVTRRVATTESTSDLIVPAAVECLQSASRNPTDIDAVLVATVTPDYAFPSTAAIVQHRLGARRAWAMDIGASSAGFVFALAQARALIMSGQARSVLVCGADKMTSVVDSQDPSTAILFGDGAGVALVEDGGDAEFGILDVVLRADGAGAQSLYLPAGGSRHPASAETVAARAHYLVQDGAAIFKAAVSMMSDVAVALMFRNNLSAIDVDWLVPHQANQRILDSVASHLSLQPSRLMSNIADTGNTWGASIPGCLAVWQHAGRLQRGDRLLLTSFGAGYVAGGAFVRWLLPRG
jgi:3-oxoacyl-[acyl-carrier-protein] synthase-3